ncbi:Shikimate kinase [Corynebacterium afermentans subsp. afermentans]|uniref:Shikimate kinase n=2 Tax=Corynebacterium afermentans TaxID=38286 RepID=A0A9X8NA74_9CORY|nr:Shikimate kinase [Corynebacterium afermentans subsp. afermentans]SIP87124.1 shikimate kinase [Corynebacterium afermentans]
MTTQTGGAPVDIVNDLVDELAPKPAEAEKESTSFEENDAPSATELVAASPAMVYAAPRVVLVGMPGAGKSTIGRRIASALNLPIVDSDVLIEQGEGKACGEVYAQLGEEAFRELEVGYVARALATGGVVSLGGGAVVSKQVRTLLQRHTVVWIDVTAEEGIRRTAEDASRPVLDGDDRQQRYRDLMEQREPLYREVSSFRVRTDERPPQRVVAEILGFIDED